MGGVRDVRVPFTSVLDRFVVVDGATVKEGAALFVVSAMKMETTVRSPCAGVVRLEPRTPKKVYPARTLAATVTPAPAAATDEAWQPEAEQVAPPRRWAAEVARLRARQAEARGLGGGKRVERQRKAGKMTARGRVSLWCDTDGAGASCGSASTETWREVGSLAGTDTSDFGEPTAFTPNEEIGGLARLKGSPAKPCVLLIDDFTVRGSHSAGDLATGRKRALVEHLAVQLSLPLIKLLDGASGGGTVTAGLRLGASYVPSLDVRNTVLLLQRGIPVVSCLCGPVVGVGALRGCLSHLCIGIRGLSQLFAAGPPVVAGASGIPPPAKEDLGGMDGVAGPSGAVDVVVDTEAQARDAADTFLDLVWYQRRRPWAGGAPDGAALLGAVPEGDSQAFDMRAAVLAHVFDEATFFEVGRLWGTAAITGIARVGGRAVGVLSCDSQDGKGGTWAADECRKAMRLVKLCEAFHLPMVNLIDLPGLAVGVEAERAGSIRAGAELTQCLYASTVKSLPIVVRRCFGVGGALGVDPAGFRLAWPSAQWGSLPSAGGVEAAAKGNPAAAAAIRVRTQQLPDPLQTARRFSIDEVIDPRETRAWISTWLGALDQPSQPPNAKL
ncbi:Propionyl-CoA carboxylase beta chain [Diplonema papillatum]|nr:Propionyl-CoA carboxylase beta chain [Diplonema papillatum]